jgi:hypothetical protein
MQYSASPKLLELWSEVGADRYEMVRSAKTGSWFCKLPQKKQEVQAAIFISCCVEAAKAALRVIVNSILFKSVFQTRSVFIKTA